MEPNYSEETIAKIKDYASNLLRPDQIALMLDLDTMEFKQTLRLKKHPASIAYNKGKLTTILAIRQQEIDLAKLGSPQAVEMVNKFIIDQELSEL
jgi:hypothetical protein